MNEQNPLMPLRDLELSSGEGRHQLPSPGAPPPPPPPAATTKQSPEINAPTPSESQPSDPIQTQLLLTQSLGRDSFLTPPLLLAENAPPPPANDGSQRRQFARKPMPFGGVAPVGEMACPGGQKWHISLWDVSMGGICVVVDSPMDEPFGTSFAISVYESFGLGSAFFNAHLRWRTTEANSTYLGLEFEDQDLLQNGCFLIDYVNTDLSNF